MKIAAHLGVLDEVELIEPCIAHLRQIGVGEFYVCDLGSTDGTECILNQMEGEDFHLLHMSNADAGEAWIARNNDFIAGCAADWMLFLDADEFVLPASGHLSPHLGPATSGVVQIPRYNVVLGSSSPMLPQRIAVESYGDICLYTAVIADFRQQLSNNPDLPWIRAVPAPKVAARPGLIGSITAGGHAVLSAQGKKLTTTGADGMVIAHVALSSYERFSHKVENFRAFFAHQDQFAGANLAWHWRRWVALADEGRLESEFRKSAIDAAELTELRARGVVQTAAEILRR